MEVLEPVSQVNDTNKPIIRLLMRTFKEDLEKDLKDPEFAMIFHKEWRAAEKEMKNARNRRDKERQRNRV